MYLMCEEGPVLPSSLLYCLATSCLRLVHTSFPSVLWPSPRGIDTSGCMVINGISWVLTMHTPSLYLPPIYLFSLFFSLSLSLSLSPLSKVFAGYRDSCNFSFSLPSLIFWLMHLREDIPYWLINHCGRAGHWQLTCSCSWPLVISIASVLFM